MGKKKTKTPTATTSKAPEPEEDAQGRGASGAVCNFLPPNYDENERNVKLDRIDINYHGHHILQEARLELTQGRRYGLIGPNGCGKSTLMNVLGMGELALPPKLDYCHLSHEVPGTEETVIDCVMKVDTERGRLEEELDYLQQKEDDATAVERMDEIFARLDELEAETAEARASRILFGLGFDTDMQERPCRSFSGGWRMRVALAQVLFLRPSLLLLDEPTNHLDIEAVVWLENYLKNFQGILLMISHSQDFMNSICTNIIQMQSGKLVVFAGNYDQYCITREEKEEHQAKRRAWEQGQMKSMKEYIARFGHGSKKMARQAQSKEKTLAKMVRGGLTSEVKRDARVSFIFPEVGYLPPPVIKFENVYFQYPGQEKCLYQEVDFGVDLDSHVCLVGPNGAGKTTLQKLITGELEPTQGFVTRNGHCVVARFNQHFVDQLDMDLTPLQYMRKEYPETKEPEVMRSWLGRFGITGGNQTAIMSTLSDGLKSRVVLSWMAQRAPHILLLDEPTNHLDMDSIDALADALNEFEGGVILVSHDMRLIAQVASEIWICDNNRVTRFNGDIADYKEVVEKRVEAAEAKFRKAQEVQHKQPVFKKAEPKKAADTKKPDPKAADGKKYVPPGGKGKAAPAAKTPEYKAPKGSEKVSIAVKKNSASEGMGIGLDADFFGDELVMLLDSVSEGGAGHRNGLMPLVGSRIFSYNNKPIKSEEDAAAFSAFVKENKEFQLVFTVPPS